MKNLFFLLFCFTSVSFSQTITVNNTATPTDLVNLLVGGSCLEINDILVSSNQSVGSFNSNGSTFPIQEGIIIRTGNITDTQGLYTGLNLSTTASGGGADPFLQSLSNVTSVSNLPLQDLAFLQFDFTPVSTFFSFDFLFASNEYGLGQCNSNDVFAFVLTNLTTGSVQNLGVIPGTTNPVTVKTIRNRANNTSCLSANPNLFDQYHVTNPTTSSLNMNGQTVVLNASSVVTPGTEYRLKLVIADYGDTNFDSAVFVSGGSFTNELDLGPDQIVCSGNTTILDTQLDNSYTFQWFQNGLPVGGNTSVFTANGPGTYTVNVTKGTCVLTDTVVFTDLMVNNPVNITTCNTGAVSYDFDLTLNNENTLGVTDTVYNVFYYTSLANAAVNNFIVTPTVFPNSVSGQTIYLKIFNTSTNQFCNTVYSFNLLINAPIIAVQPSNVSLCLNDSALSLNTLNAQVLNGQNGYGVFYYNTQTDANVGNGAEITSVSPLANPGTQVVWIRMQDLANPTCFSVTNVTITTHPLPLVSTLPEVVACSSYVLPTITNGNYFTGPNGTGTPLFAGNTIDLSATYYIYSGPDANGCYNQTSFTATFIDEYSPILDNCGRFNVPIPPYNIGGFYTATGGPNGTGTLVPAGTIYTNNTQSTIIQTLYYYAEVNGVFCRDERFDINIHGNPLLDLRSDVTYCNTYTLPSITNGTYNTSSDGTGTTLNAGDIISVNGPNLPGTYYVVNSLPHTNSNGSAGACSLYDPFVVNLVDTTLFTTVYSCSNVGYMLPPISFGGYYTAPMGGGNLVDPNILITTSQTVYYYTNTSLLPNCTDNLNYNIVINQAPAVFTIADGEYCGEYVLPNLPIGNNYYTLSGGPLVTGQQQLNAGDVIDLSGLNLTPSTYYVYNETIFNNPGGSTTICSNEDSFAISILALPDIDIPINSEECVINIPAQPLGQVYTGPNGPNGTGVLVQPTDNFTATTTFYLYYEDPITGCKIDEPFIKEYIGINLPNFDDVIVCNSFTLATLNPNPLAHVPPESFTNYSIGYFFNSDGTNPVPSGHVFNSANTPISVYVYATNDGRFNTCSEFDEIRITVSDIPVIPNMVFPISDCGTYTLPTLPTVGYNIGYFTSPNGVGPITNLDIINNTGTPGNPAAISQTYTYYVYATAFNNSRCNDQEVFTFTVHPLLNFPIADGIICVDPVTNTTIDSYTIDTGLNPAIYTVKWSLNNVLVSSGPSFTATQAGNYVVEFIKLIPEVGALCNYNNTTFQVVASSPAVASFTVSPEFNTETTFITINLTGGLGQYQYQLEYPNGTTSAFQTSTTFSNLETGEYFVNIYDLLGNCTPSRVGPIYIVNYPNYFTPNGDGIHETWNITDLAQQPESIISIFDRYGKLLKQISPAGIGWDGTYNGKNLPSTDYWFTVEYISQNQQKNIFKSHFSLKR